MNARKDFFAILCIVVWIISVLLISYLKIFVYTDMTNARFAIEFWYIIFLPLVPAIGFILSKK